MITILESCDYMDKNLYSGEYELVKGSEVYLTKQIRHSEVIPASMVKKFRLKAQYSGVDTLDKLYPHLLKLEKNPHACVIRYKYHSAEVGDKVYRRASELECTEHRLIAMDIDNLDLPEHISHKNVLTQGKYVLSLLSEICPDFFNKDTGFIAQASSSAGMSSKKIKLHLWLRNKSPITQQQIKNACFYVNRLYKEKNSTKKDLIDLALYSIGQIHFTAAPIFQRKTDDPFHGIRRTVICEGDNCYIPQSYPEWVSPIRTTQQEKSEYLKGIEGSVYLNKATQTFLDIVEEWDPNVRGLRVKVIALYHNAIQSQFNLEVLDKIVRGILSKKRPGQEQQYINEAKAAAMNHIKACSAREIHDEVLGLKIDKMDSGSSRSKFLNIQSFPKSSAIFMKASLGTGKTATIERLLRNGSIRGNFLAITDTSALVEANCNRFNALDYREKESIDAFNLKETDRLSGTLHSVQKLSRATRRFDFVFIDEADSVLNTLLFASIISDGKRMLLVETLSNILQKADRVVFSDGDLSQETVQCYTELMEGSKPIVKIDHNRKNLKGVKAFRHKSKESLWGAVDSALSLGDKCIVLTDNNPDQLNIYQDSLKDIHPDRNIEVAHANSKFDPVTRDIINNTTKALEQHSIDCLICSPSITSGVDFNYFDTAFVSTSSEIHPPNMRFQALMRERSPKEIHYYISPRVRGFDTGYSNLSIELDWVNSSRKLLAARKEREFKTYGATFNYYLVKAGCTIKYVDDPYTDPKEQERVEKYYDEKAEAVLKSAEGVIVPRHNNLIRTYKTIKDVLQVETPTFKQIRNFVVNSWEEKLEFFHKIVDSFWDILKTQNPSKINEALKGPRGHEFYLLTGMSVKSKTGTEILDDCGISRTMSIDDYVDMYIRYCVSTSKPISPAVQENTIDELGVS